MKRCFIPIENFHLYVMWRLVFYCFLIYFTHGDTVLLWQMICINWNGPPVRSLLRSLNPHTDLTDRGSRFSFITPEKTAAAFPARLVILKCATKSPTCHSRHVCFHWMWQGQDATTDLIGCSYWRSGLSETIRYTICIFCGPALTSASWFRGFLGSLFWPIRVENTGTRRNKQSRWLFLLLRDDITIKKRGEWQVTVLIHMRVFHSVPALSCFTRRASVGPLHRLTSLCQNNEPYSVIWWFKRVTRSSVSSNILLFFHFRGFLLNSNDLDSNKLHYTTGGKLSYRYGA